MTGFKLRGFPAEETQPDVVEVGQTPEAEPQQEKKRTRGPYKKRDKEADKLASMSPIDRLLFALEGIEGAPDKVTLEEWKDLHGTFYMSSIDRQRVYIWKTIKRTEYKNLLTSGAMDKAQLLEEFVVRRCLLWPKYTAEFGSGSDAGVISTLFKQIWYKSGFISDDEALNMIEKI